MAQTTQIVPKFSFPYVETHINDYTTVTNNNVDYGVMDPVVSYIFPFVSSKGIDNRFIKYHGRANIIKAYGNSNWKKYGQPLMQVLNIADSLNSEIWCMRVMPENAEYARNIVSVYYRGDTETNVREAHKRRFRIKFIKNTAKSYNNDEDVYEDIKVTTVSDLQHARYTSDDVNVVDDEGYTCEPGVFTFRSAGRGVYGNNYRVRATQNMDYEKEYGIKMYDFEVLSNENALTKESTYTGTLVTSPKYETTSFINDVLDDTEVGTAPLFINVDEDAVENIYAAYADWFNANKDALVAEIDELKTAIDGTYDAETDTFYTTSDADSATIETARYFDGILYTCEVKKGTYDAETHKFTLADNTEITEGEAGVVYYDTTATKYYEYSTTDTAFVEITDTSSIIVEPASDKIYHDTTTDKYYKLESGTLVETTSTTDTTITPVVDTQLYHDTTTDKYYVYTSVTTTTTDESTGTTTTTTGNAYVTDDDLAPITDRMINGTETYSTLAKPIVKLIRSITNMITVGAPDVDTFDLLFGRGVRSQTQDQFIAYPQRLTSTIDQTAADFDRNAYTDSENVVYFDSIEGINLEGGDDGYFDANNRRQVTTIVDGVEQVSYWSLDQEIEECYKKAFNGTYDKRILSPKRLKATALWDANYPMSVKSVLADLALCRNDGICYLDVGIRSNLSLSNIESLIDDFAGFNDHKISKNIHHYYTREYNTKKKVPVTISYYLSRKFADHAVNYGTYIPFVKNQAQLDNFIKDSLSPTIEDYETTFKELLVENRFNYFDVVDDGVYQRATQNTTQTAISDLLEENNVHTLYDIKRIVEKDISDRLYDFTDQTIRQNFRNYEIAKFENWSSKQVQSFDIEFRMNEWEAERSILHAYISVVFRGLQKRAILEIDINKRTYVEDQENETDSFSYTY